MERNIEKEKREFAIPVFAKWTAKIVRVDGSVEITEYDNIVTDVGMDFVAKFLSTAPDSAMNFMAVGSGTGAGSLGSTILVNEVARNVLASRLSSNNVLIAVATFAGNTDGITSFALGEAGLFNDVDSGQTLMFQRVNGTLATLGDSDFLNLTIETTIGSKA